MQGFLNRRLVYSRRTGALIEGWVLVSSPASCERQGGGEQSMSFLFMALTLKPLQLPVSQALGRVSPQPRLCLFPAPPTTLPCLCPAHSTTRPHPFSSPTSVPPTLLPSPTQSPPPPRFRPLSSPAPPPLPKHFWSIYLFAVVSETFSDPFTFCSLLCYFSFRFCIN